MFAGWNGAPLPDSHVVKRHDARNALDLSLFPGLTLPNLRPCGFRRRGQDSPMLQWLLSVRMMVLAPALLLGCGQFSAPLFAAPNYFVRTWQVENGLPQNSVTAIVQTRDGYLWAGTYSGLVRFDGVHFAVFDENNTPEMRNSRVTSLFEAPDVGTLWIGDESGTSTQYKNGQFKAVEFHPAWNGRKIYDIGADESGDVWLLNEVGRPTRTFAGRTGFERPESRHGGQAGAYDPLLPTEKSGWRGTAGYRCWNTANCTASGSRKRKPTLMILGIGASIDGGLWVAGDQRIRKWKDNRWGGGPGSDALGRHCRSTRWIETTKRAFWRRERQIAAFNPGYSSRRRKGRCISIMPAGSLRTGWLPVLRRPGRKSLGRNRRRGTRDAASQQHCNVFSPPDQWQRRAVLSVFAPAGRVRCGWELRARGCIAFKREPGPILVPTKGFSIPTSGPSPRMPVETCGWARRGGGLFVRHGQPF